MQNQTIQKVVTEIKNDTVQNKTNFLIALATLGVLLLALVQQEQAKPIQIKNAQEATYTMTLINAPQPGPNEE